LFFCNFALVIYLVETQILGDDAITAAIWPLAFQHVVILLFQPQGRFDTVLAASPWQDRPPGPLFQHRYAAVIWYPRYVVIWQEAKLSLG